MDIDLLKTTAPDTYADFISTISLTETQFENSQEVYKISALIEYLDATVHSILRIKVQQGNGQGNNSKYARYEQRIVTSFNMLENTSKKGKNKE